MLVLTRKVGEKIHLGDEIVVTVTAVSGQQVRLGIAAPPHVPILRNELVVRAEPQTEASGEKKSSDELGSTGGSTDAEQARRPRSLRTFRPRMQPSV
jgi:carbon storage regulator